jgi:ribosomal protein L29
MSDQNKEYEVRDYTDEELKAMPSQAKKDMFRRQFKFKGEFLMGKQLLLQA